MPCRPPLLLPLAAVLLLVLPALPARSAPGQLEINQTCAAQTGCFPGDAPGFPVTIDEPGSYRLTGSLALPADVDGVVIATSYVTLDLAGFEIAGVASCSGTGGSLACGSGAGSGVLATGGLFGVTVRDGTLRNHPFLGLHLQGGGHRAVAVLARHNGGGGIRLAPGSRCEGCTAVENAGDGIRVDGGGGVVRDSTAFDNQGAGFLLAPLARFGTDNASSGNGLSDDCGGGICTHRRRFYMTPASFDGSEPDEPGVCAPGFHFAAVTELAGPSELEYDPKLGHTVADGGQGAPNFILGWARGGFDGPVGACGGNAAANCMNWTSTAGDECGRVVVAPGPTATRDFSGVWADRAVACNVVRQAWCIED